MERVIYKRSLSIVESNNGLLECQFGFCHARSTVDAVTMVVNLANDELSYNGCCAGLGVNVKMPLTLSIGTELNGR